MRLTVSQMGLMTIYLLLFDSYGLAVFWDVAPCRYFVNRRFGGTYGLHLQGISYLLTLVHRSWISSTLKMEEIRSSETSVHTISTRHHIPEDGILHSHRRENLKSHIVTVLFFVGRPLWRQDGSVFCICCWPLPARSSSYPSPLVLVTVFHCLRFETSFSSPPTTRGVTVELFDPASTLVWNHCSKPSRL
jgi:hypothetical protein